jgi:hypothetical protein
MRASTVRRLQKTLSRTHPDRRAAQLFAALREDPLFSWMTDEQLALACNDPTLWSEVDAEKNLAGPSGEDFRTGAVALLPEGSVVSPSPCLAPGLPEEGAFNAEKAWAVLEKAYEGKARDFTLLKHPRAPPGRIALHDPSLPEGAVTFPRKP